MNRPNFTSVFIAVFLGTGLVFIRDRLAATLFSESSHPFDTCDVQAVAFSVLGCYFTILGVSRFIDWQVQIHWGAVVQIGLGVVLFFGARGLTEFWSFSRSVGRTRNAE